MGTLNLGAGAQFVGGANGLSDAPTGTIIQTAITGSTSDITVNSDGSYTGMVTAENGDGMSDNVAYELEGGGDITQARISKDEYIVDENQVKALGDGDADKGAKRLDKLREEIRKQAYGTTKQPKEISASKTLQQFLKEV